MILGMQGILQEKILTGREHAQFPNTRRPSPTRTLGKSFNPTQCWASTTAPGTEEAQKHGFQVSVVENLVEANAGKQDSEHQSTCLTETAFLPFPGLCQNFLTLLSFLVRSQPQLAFPLSQPAPHLLPGARPR